MDGSQGHEGHQQHRGSDGQQAKVSIAAGGDNGNESGGEHHRELKGDAGIRGR